MSIISTVSSNSCYRIFNSKTEFSLQKLDQFWWTSFSFWILWNILWHVAISGLIENTVDLNNTIPQTSTQTGFFIFMRNILENNIGIVDYQYYLLFSKYKRQPYLLNIKEIFQESEYTTHYFSLSHGIQMIEYQPTLLRFEAARNIHHHNIFKLANNRTPKRNKYL